MNIAVTDCNCVIRRLVRTQGEPPDGFAEFYERANMPVRLARAIL